MTIDNRINKLFPPNIFFWGYVFILLGLIITVSRPLIGLGLLILGGFVAFTSTGIQIETKEKKYKEYISYFGLKKGTWNPIDKFKYIAVLSKTLSQTSYSRGQVAMSIKEKAFDICLLSDDHRLKITMKRLKDEGQSIDEAKKLAELLNITFTTYSPVISEKTKARRKK